MIKTLAFEDRSEGRLKQLVVESPHSGAITSAIESLDGVRNTMVVIQTTGEETLTIGGGNGGLCVIDFSTANEQFLTLRHQRASAREREIVSGGQLAPFRETYLMPLSVAIEVASNWSGGTPVEPEGCRWVNSSEVC